jgi:hypothetical protein
MNRLPLSGDEASCSESALRLREVLRALCADPETHTRFLNTLSLLEHIGSRKIMLSRVKSRDGALLKHLAEESRHSFFFKRAAEKLARRPLDYSASATIAGAAARLYMDRLDARISAALKPDSLPYLYMSLIIEDRAVWAYRIYHSVLAEQKTGISLSSVLAEERLHLDAMLAEIHRRDTGADEHITAFCGVEHLEFNRFWRAIETALQPLQLAAQ